MAAIHLKDVNTLHSCNVIKVEGWLPSTWITLHVCNVFKFLLNVTSLAEKITWMWSKTFETCKYFEMLTSC